MANTSAATAQPGSSASRLPSFSQWRDSAAVTLRRARALAVPKLHRSREISALSARRSRAVGRESSEERPQEGECRQWLSVAPPSVGCGLLNHRCSVRVLAAEPSSVWIESTSPPHLGRANWLALFDRPGSPESAEVPPTADRQPTGSRGRTDWSGSVTVERCHLTRVERSGGDWVSVYRSRLLREAPR